MHGGRAAAAGILSTMLESNATQGCRNNFIKTRRLFVAAWLAIWIPLSADAIEIETPAVGLAGVPLEYWVSGATDGDVVVLSVAGESWTSTANVEGRAVFDEVLIAEAGTTIVAASIGERSSPPMGGRILRAGRMTGSVRL